MMKLLLGGSPCTHWSIAKTKNRETKPEGIGWELFKNYLIALEKYKPDYFLYENNKSMSPAIKEQITKEFGVAPILINSAKVSAQSRQRLYWVGKRNQDGTYGTVPVEQPVDRGILLRDILETTTNERGYALKPLSDKEMDYMVRQVNDGRNHFDFDYHHDATKEKSSCVTANTYKGVPYNVLAEPVGVGYRNRREDDGKLYRRFETHGEPKSNALTKVQTDSMVAEPVRIGTVESGEKSIRQDSQAIRVYSAEGKSVTLSSGGGGQGGKTGLYATPVQMDDQNQISVQYNSKKFPVYEVNNGLIRIKGKDYPIKLADGFYIIRKLTVLECMRLQTVPEWYKFPASNTQCYKMLGNGWTCDVIAHILSYMDGIQTEPVEVLSMYDGMSCGHIALDKLGTHITAYYSTEIDKYAIKTTQANYPNTIQLGDAFQVRENNWNLYMNEHGEV